MRAVSLKRAPAVRRRAKLLKARQGDPCEIRWDMECRGVGVTLHEPLLRSRGGDPASEEGTVWTCFMCHSNVHANPIDSIERGWMIHSWEAKVGN